MEKPQGEQQRRDPSPRTGRRAIDVVYRQEDNLQHGIRKHGHGISQLTKKNDKGKEEE